MISGLSDGHRGSTNYEGFVVDVSAISTVVVAKDTRGVVRLPRWKRWTLAMAIVAAWAIALVPGAWPLSAAQWAMAQDSEAPKEEEAKKSQAYDKKLDAQVDIDMLSFIQSEEVFKPETTDGIWDFKPGVGRIMIQVPFKVKPGSRDTELDQSDIKLKSGRFVCWKLTDPPEKAPKGSNAAKEIADAKPDGPPLFSRKITITPDGDVKWGLDRAIFGGTVKEGTRMYIYKLKTDYFNKKRPVLAKGGDAAQFRNETAAYQQLAKDVRELPTEFKQPLPMRVWGVYELPGTYADFDINILDTMQWKVPLNHLKTIRKNMTPVQAPISADGKARLSKEGMDLQVALNAILAGNPPNPLAARCAAYNLIFSRLIPIMEPNDATYRVVQQILKSTDSSARIAVIKELGSTIPPTVASMALLKESALSLSVDEQRRALEEMLKGGGAAESQETTIATINRSLANPSGPSARDVLASVLESVDKKPETMSAFLNGIRFDTLPDKRLDDAMSYIVEKSSASALAANWLNLRFLGSTDQRIVERTLELISTADASDEWFRDKSRSMLTVVMNPPAKASQNSTRIRLGGAIPITSGQHSFFTALQSGNPNVRALAWSCLPRFALVSPAAADAAAAAAEQADPYAALLRIALDQTPTPAIVVDFLSRQKDAPRVLDGLVRLVLRGTDKASVQATRALLKPRTWPLDQALLKLPYGDRHGFATRVYENAGARVPLAVFLMKQRLDNNPLVTWFGKEMASGRMPNPVDYAAQYGNDERLLELVPGSDTDLAQGAVSALVLAAGGDDIMAREQAGKLRGLKDQSAANIRTEWQKVRRSVYVGRIQKAAGAYRLVVHVGPGNAVNASDPNKTPAPVPAQDISLGIVQLTADATGVRLANGSLTMAISDTSLAIRMEKPSELKNFAAEPLAKIPLEKSDKPIDLTLQSDGSWRGSLTLSDGRPLDLIFQPTAAGSGG